MENTFFVKMLEACNEDGQPYTDKRSTYIEKSGLLHVLQVNEQYKRLIFYSIDENDNVARITTSNGVVVENETTIMIRTKHSRYLFSKDYSLTQEEELKLTDYFTANS